MARGSQQGGLDAQPLSSLIVRPALTIWVSRSCQGCKLSVSRRACRACRQDAAANILLCFRSLKLRHASINTNEIRDEMLLCTGEPADAGVEDALEPADGLKNGPRRLKPRGNKAHNERQKRVEHQPLNPGAKLLRGGNFGGSLVTSRLEQARACLLKHTSRRSSMKVHTRRRSL